MDQSIDINDWLDRLDEAIELVAKGEKVVITRNGVAVAALSPRPGIEP